MKNLFFSIVLSTIFIACSNIARERECHVSFDNNVISVETNDTSSFHISVWSGELKLWDTTSRGNVSQYLFNPINDAELINSLALSALNNNYELPINIKVDECVDTTFVIKVNPDEGDSVAPIISGNCARLITDCSNISSSESLKRWLFKKKEFVGDSLLIQLSGLVRTISKKEVTTYNVQGNIPVVKSLEAYSVSTGIKADHYALLACISDDDVSSFVEECIANDFKYSQQNLDEQLHCYKMGNPNGFLCICLVTINDDWSYKAYPIGAIMIDNIPPIILNQTPIRDADGYDTYLSQNYHANFNDIILNNKSKKIVVPENKPKVASTFSISIGHFEGSMYLLSMPFTAYFDTPGDIKSVTIRHPKSGDVAKTIELKEENSPFSFRCSLYGMEYGENYIPIEVEDIRGNTSTFKLRQDCQKVEENNHKINIDNNVNVW